MALQRVGKRERQPPMMAQILVTARAQGMNQVESRVQTQPIEHWLAGIFAC